MSTQPNIPGAIITLLSRELCGVAKRQFCLWADFINATTGENFYTLPLSLKKARMYTRQPYRGRLGKDSGGHSHTED